MPRNVSSQDMLAVNEYLTGVGSLESIAKKYNVSYKALSAWINNYKAFGASAFIRSGHNQN